ncbi:MAG: hypothetical protein SOV36_07685, partial [Anaerostipes faecalis]|nr:hypothetical protein [Anaerostipes faecalis]
MISYELFLVHGFIVDFIHQHLPLTGMLFVLLGKHSIASEAFCMNQVTFALQNIKIRLWQAVKIL